MSLFKSTAVAQMIGLLSPTADRKQRLHGALVKDSSCWHEGRKNKVWGGL